MEPLSLGECFCALSAPYCDFTVKPRRVRCVSSEKNPNHFLPGRTPGWLLLPLRGNSPPVPGRKYNSGCKSGASRSESNGTIASGNCSIMYGICSPMANKLCAQQTAKTGGKARRGFSTSSSARAVCPGAGGSYSFSFFSAVICPWATPSVDSGIKRILMVAKIIFRSVTTPMEPMYCKSICSLL